MWTEITLQSNQKYLLIRSIIKNILKYLCKTVSVGRSGYYNYFSATSQIQLEKRIHQD